MKVCTKCQAEKPLDEFYRDSSKSDGHRYDCKKCYSLRKKQHYLENREKILSERQQYQAANRQSISEYKKLHYRKNREDKLAWQRQYRNDNREAVRLANAEWRRKNPEKKRALESRRRAREVSAKITSFTAEQLALRWDYYGNRCYLCGDEATQSDHVKPLAKGGAHALCNLRPICQPCNGRKGDRWPYAPVFERGVSCVTTSRPSGF